MLPCSCPYMSVTHCNVSITFKTRGAELMLGNQVTLVLTIGGETRFSSGADASLHDAMHLAFAEALFGELGEWVGPLSYPQDGDATEALRRVFYQFATRLEMQNRPAQPHYGEPDRADARPRLALVSPAPA